MAETNVPFVQCDLCPAKIPRDKAKEAKFEKLGDIDICPGCFDGPFQVLAHGVSEAWYILRQPGNGPHNGKVVELLGKMFNIALHEFVGGEATE